MFKRISLTAFLAVFVLAFAAACSAAAPVQSSMPNALAAPPASNLGQTEGMDLLNAYQATLEGIYQQVAPSVVNIRVVKQVEIPTSLFSDQVFPFFNLPQDQAPTQSEVSLGSGFVWDADGHIVTNNHVVNGADKIEVTFSDGTILKAELVGYDPDSDLAVISVDSPASLLRPIQVADSNSVQVGQMAIAIGNPFGLEGSMTVGIVSALGRDLPVSSSTGPSYSIPDIIQTDAPINPGNSGGVLVDDQGMLIGVTAAIESPVQANAGVGFAIPSAIVEKVVPALIQDGKYEHTWLGISGSTLTPDLASAMNLDSSQRGILIGDVLPNSPADDVGLRGSDRETTIDGQSVRVGGDVLTAIDGKPLRDIDELIAYLARYTTVGQKVDLTLLRDGKELSLSVTLQARPSVDDSSQAVSGSEGVRLGIVGADMNADLAEAMGLPSDQAGVMVVQVEQGGLGDQAGLRGSFKPVTIRGQQVLVGGDIITAVDGHQVSTFDDLRTALDGIRSGTGFELTVLRGSRELTLQVPAGN